MSENEDSDIDRKAKIEKLINKMWRPYAPLTPQELLAQEQKEQAIKEETERIETEKQIQIQETESWFQTVNDKLEELYNTKEGQRFKDLNENYELFKKYYFEMTKEIEKTHDAIIYHKEKWEYWQKQFENTQKQGIERSMLLEETLHSTPQEFAIKYDVPFEMHVKSMKKAGSSLYKDVSATLEDLQKWFLEDSTKSFKTAVEIAVKDSEIAIRNIGFHKTVFQSLSEDLEELIALKKKFKEISGNLFKDTEA